MASDPEMLTLLAEGRTEAALADIVARYGTMVYRVARRVTGDSHRAEDVCQAVFCLLLAEKGAARNIRSLGAWLHHVTVIAARNALRTEVRRRKHEQEASKMSRGGAGSEMELPEGFDGALDRLAEPYRQAIVLRFLRGMSRSEAAVELGVDEGTVDSRMSRGLERLRRALAGGVAMAALTQALVAEAASAAGAESLPFLSTAALPGASSDAGVAFIMKGTVKAMVWMKVKMVAALLACTATVGIGSAVAVSAWSAPQEKPLAARSTQEQRKGPLAGLPSAPGPHIARIKALGDNEWLYLGSPAPDPKWGKARGRSWGAKMPYAAGIGGCFLAGEGPHEYVKRDGPDAGYVMDDVWFYDVNAHRWICLYPGASTKTFNQEVKDGLLKVNDDGQIVDKDAQPIPVHVLTHAWGNLTYNPDQRKFSFYVSRHNCGSYFLAPALAEGAKLLGAQWLNKKPAGPWFYDVATGTFENVPVTGEPPDNRGEPAKNQFLYVPSKKKYLCTGSEGTWYYDPTTRSWQGVAVKGKNPGGIDHGACHDSKRDRIYLGGGQSGATKPEDNFWSYDIKSETWTKPNPSGAFPVGYSSNNAFFHYDSVNDVVVIMASWGQQIFVYHPETNTMTSVSSTIPPELVNVIVNGYGTGNGFYDPELNAHVCHFAMDGRDNGAMWAYRYKKVKR